MTHSNESDGSSTNRDEEASHTQNGTENHQSPPVNGTDFMNQFLGAIQGFIQQQSQAHFTAQPNPTPVTRTIDEGVERFRQYNAPRFNGRDGPLVVEEWFEEMEHIFTHIGCTDKEKVACAIFQLKDDARKWWNSFYRMLGEEDRKLLNWKIFKGVVMDKYFPVSFREQKETEFFELKQGSTTIENYERKFNNLSQFAPHLVDTESKTIARFKKGLRTDIKGIMASHVIDDFSELVKRAEEVEMALGMNNPTPKLVGNFGKRKWEERNPGKGNF